MRPLSLVSLVIAFCLVGLGVYQATRYNSSSFPNPGPPYFAARNVSQAPEEDEDKAATDAVPPAQAYAVPHSSCSSKEGVEWKAQRPSIMVSKRWAEFTEPWREILLPPLCFSSSSEWCSLVESQRVAFKTQKELPPGEEECNGRYASLHQSNFSKIADVVRYADFPRHDPTRLTRITQQERSRYWARNPDPLNRDCLQCVAQLTHLPLYSLRRWWLIPLWIRANASGDATAWSSLAHLLTLSEDRLTGHPGRVELLPKTRPPVEVILRRDIQRVSLYPCLPKEDQAFVVIETAEDRHWIQFLLQGPGLRCFWRSLQVLWPDVAKRSYEVSGGRPCNVRKAPSSPPPKVSNGSTSVRQMPLDSHFPYLPCHKFEMTSLMANLSYQGGYDSFQNFWPQRCAHLRQVSPYCGAAADMTPAPPGEQKEIQVAVALAGLVRSFASTKSEIYEKIILPNNAAIFGVTWNIVGRSKKTRAVHKKHSVPVGTMLRTLKQMIGFDVQNATSHKGRLEVYNYFDFVKRNEFLRVNGFSHAGMYFAICRSLQLVNESGLRFDIVIRTRFDIYPAAPLTFIKMLRVTSSENRGGSNEKEAVYQLNVGSSCEMQNSWFPQRALVERRKILKHYADTRFKLFAWQVCDWMEIGQHDAMMELGNLYQWTVQNNVWSAAQFVDHAFFVDQLIAYQPLNLYLKIWRNHGRLWG